MNNFQYPYPQNNFQLPQVIQNQQTMPVPTQTQQLQTNGLVIVRSEEEARNYPIAYGNSVTFKDETAPYIYTKTMGFSQMDRPIFEKFKLVKEDVEGGSATEITPTIDLSVLDDIKTDIEALWDEVKFLRDTRTKSSRKKEVSDE